MENIEITPIGVVVSPLRDRAAAPKQGAEGAPDAEVHLDPRYADAAADLAAGDDVVVVTWLHQADREVRRVHPRSDEGQPLTGVFSTRAPDRPNPVGLHPVRVLGVDGLRLRVRGLEAIDGTPVVDLKPLLPGDARPAAASFPAPPRSRAQRIRDTRTRLEHDVDAWVASADGGPYLVPLSFLWDGETVLLSTKASSPTARNLAATGRVRLALGESRDVVVVDGPVAVLASDGVPAAVADAFAAKTGFDPRDQSPAYPWFRVSPTRIQAWREVDELAGREVMRDGRWLPEAGPAAP